MHGNTKCDSKMLIVSLPEDLFTAHMYVRLYLYACINVSISSHGSMELCCLWPNIMELAASRIKNYANPTGIF